MLDWVTGEPNAKYFVTQLLASTVGAAKEKALYSYSANPTPMVVAGTASPQSTSADVAAALYVLPFRFTANGGERGVLLINKKAVGYNVTLVGGLSTTTTMAATTMVAAEAVATVVEVNPGYRQGPGFQPPLTRLLSDAGELYMGPFAVAVVMGTA